MLVENDLCENCESSGLVRFIDRPAHVLKRCPSCNLYQKGTLETQLIYEDDYHDCYSIRLAEKIKTAKIRLGAAKHYLDLNQQLDSDSQSSIRSLDIGCSVGAAVTAAKEFGWEASGVDVSPNGHQILRESRFGLPSNQRCSSTVCRRDV